MKKTDYTSECCGAPVELDDTNPNWKQFICTKCNKSGGSLSVEDLLKEANKDSKLIDGEKK